jgi:hypothetical protein
MSAGWVPLTASIRAAGPIGLWQFSELLPGSPVTAGSQDPQNLALDSSASGNLNPGSRPQANGNYLQYGSAVVGNSFASTTSTGSNAQSSAVFPNTATTSINNIIGGGLGIDVALQPTAAISVGCQVTPAVCATGSVKQVMVCYGSDASSLAAYKLYHAGSTAINHTFAFAVNIAGTVYTATATTPVVVVGTSYFVMGTYDGTNVRIYVNGVLQGTTAATGAISYASIGAYGLTFGNDGSLSDANLQGSLGIVGIYGYALTQTQITYLARQGSTYLPFPWRH